jgi:hypothetical protein
MQSTIVTSKGKGKIIVSRTVRKTVEVMGPGFVSTQEIMWAINSQMDQKHPLAYLYLFTEKEVQAALNAWASECEETWYTTRKGIMRKATDRFWFFGN